MSDVETAKAHFFAALDLLDAHDYGAAEQRLRAALAIVPDRVSALSNLAVALFEQGKLDEAMATAERVLRVEPDDFEARIVAGSTFAKRAQFAEALAEYDKAVAAHPDHARGHLARGVAHLALKQVAAALADYREAARLSPGDIEAVGGLAWAQLMACEWQGLDDVIGRTLAAVRSGAASILPFHVLAMTDDPAEQLAAARKFCAHNFPPSPAVRPHSRPSGERLRVAYVSNDFRRHPTGEAIVGVLEQHDHAGFEVFGISLGPDDGSEVRRRAAAACDHFLDARELSDEAISDHIRREGIDVAVDLGGHTAGARPRIFSARPAPIQLNYLGFPGTSGAPFIDYVIGDRVVIPPEDEPCYSEAVVRLPDTYHATDNRRATPDVTPSRSAAGLPGDGFVFCCFNASYKIVPPMFGVWMDILRAVPGSVLWLLANSDAQQKNLAGEAAARGIDPARLIFAPSVPADQHLARHRVADLSLDTLPYNAHTTATDALWFGLPLVTCEGRTFAARVAASLLRAIGLPELVTTSLDDFRALAIALARDPARLAAIRARLAANRDTTPLFDTARTTRHLEAAYRGMVERHRRGERPASFNVTPIV